MHNHLYDPTSSVFCAAINPTPTCTMIIYNRLGVLKVTYFTADTANL